MHLGGGGGVHCIASHSVTAIKEIYSSLTVLPFPSPIPVSGDLVVSVKIT